MKDTMVFKRKILVIKSAMIHHHVIYTEIIGCMFFNNFYLGVKLYRGVCT